MESKKRTRRKTKKQSFFMTLVFTAAAALAIYFAVSFFSAYKDIEKTIKENDEAAIAEKCARENGYVKTDERVYIDITPGT